jgi:hypothetical protein
MGQDTNALLRDRLLDRPILPIPIPTTTADKGLVTRPCLLIGWSLRETTGAGTASVEFEGSQSTAGPIVGEQVLASGGSGNQHIANEGVLCEGGLLLHVVSGSVTGVVWARV